MASLRERFATRKISVPDVARQSGISEARLNELLAGEEGSLSELRRLAKVLKVPISNLLSAAPRSDRVAVLFREGIGNRHVDSEVVIEDLTRYATNVLSVASDLPRNTAWLKPFPAPDISFESAARAAEQFRYQFYSDDQLNPLHELPQIVSERLGVFAFIVANLPVEGASVQIGGFSFIFLAPRTFVPRMLFTLAHEIGHFIGQHHSAGDFATLDWPGEFGTAGTPKKKLEAFCDWFASALLMPLGGVGISLEKIRKLHNQVGPLGDLEIGMLARIYGVSFEVAARRCEDLQLIPRGGARALYEKVTKEFGSPEKRADDIDMPPRSEIEFLGVAPNLLQAVTEKIRKGELSVGKAASLLRVPISQLYSANAQSAQ